jgi:hypothetical protein
LNLRTIKEDPMDKCRLDLSRHCVETEIKRRYNRAISDYFRADEQSRRCLARVIDLTQLALESLDFNHLRSEYAPLAGHSDAQVVLVRDADRLSILIDGRAIDP